MPIVEAYYLDIEWKAPGLARRIDVDPRPIDIQTGSDGALTIETQIFHDMHPWVGLRLSKAQAASHPAFIDAEGTRQPMLAIYDGDGRGWWVQNDGWDTKNKRHLSELHRTAGQFDIDFDDLTLRINNIVVGFRQAQLQEYLDDFKDDLIWLVTGFGSGTTTSSAPSGDAALADALQAFTSATKRVLENPARNTREIMMESRISQLRPNGATFRQYARNPHAQRLVGRGTEETADIADNRYLRHMVKVCERLARSVAQSAQRQAQSFTARAEMENERSNTYLTMNSRAVDPDIFDRQQAELDAKLDRVASYTDGIASERDGMIRDFQLSVGSRFSQETDKLFYNKAGGEPASDTEHGIRYSVLKIPEELAQSMLAASGFSRVYTLRGIAKISRWWPNRKDVRIVSFSHVVSVTPHTKALENKQRKRLVLEQNGWQAPLSNQEREELRQEARTAAKRGQAYQERGQRTSEALAELSKSQAELYRQNRTWEEMGVTSSTLFPTGMRYSQSPDYATCLAAFHRVSAVAEQSGISDSTLEEVDRIGILHASALYERWCLVKIISVLIEEFGFSPEPGWTDRLIQAVTGLSESLTLCFHRHDVALKANLEIQPVLANGKRPDFRINFYRENTLSANEDIYIPIFTKEDTLEKPPGLIMDAKFRTQWRPGALTSMLDDLVDVKDYGQMGDRVFILQPEPNTIWQATSPLDWGKDCDFGQDAELNHRKGMIHLAPGNGVNNPVAHLRRLIALELQSVFSGPERNPKSKSCTSASFCIRCGQKHEPGDIEHKETKKGNSFWILHCTQCGMKTTRTHCFGDGCGMNLFKNGFHLTYHRTLADQISNVVCPSCGEYFDRDFLNDSNDI